MKPPKTIQRQKLKIGKFGKSSSEVIEAKKYAKNTECKVPQITLTAFDEGGKKQQK